MRTGPNRPEVFASLSPSSNAAMTEAEPPRDCELCERLVRFRRMNRKAEPHWFNAPVPSFGDANGRLAIVGLAPGLKGANRTGRPFTGDFAGDLLYGTLIAHGFARGHYRAAVDDGLELVDCLVTNAVRCVPPENKPTPAEARACRRFLEARLAAMPNLEVVLALGRIAHDSAVRAIGARPAAFPFVHGGSHAVRPGLALFDSYHCSRYNTNTGRLTHEMFAAVVRDIRRRVDRSRAAAP